MTSQNHPQARIVFWIAIASMLIIGSAVDMFVPSLPSMQLSLTTTHEAIRLVVGIYLISYAIFQLFMGALSDRLGRKWLLTLCLFAMSISTYFITQTKSIDDLLLLRALQGVFAAGIGVIGRGLIPDVFYGQDTKKHATYLTFAWSAGPILSPYLGAHLQHAFNWHASFYAMAIYAFALGLVTLIALPETLKKPQSLHIKNILHNYTSLLRSHTFVCAVVMCGIGYGCVTIFNAVGPFLVEHRLGYDAVVFGRVALIMGLSWFIGGLLYRFSIGKKIERVLSRWIPLAFFAISVILLLLSLTTTLNIVNLVLPISGLFITGGFLFSENFSLALSRFPEKAGITSAAMGALYSIMAGIAACIGSVISAHHLTPLAITFLLLALAMFIVAKLRRRANQI